MDVPALLRAARGTREVSQRGLAELAGLPRSTVDRIEAGLTDPRVGTVERLFRALGYEVTICTGQGRLLRIDEERERLIDYGGRHFPPHWGVREVKWNDDWWGWWRKNGPRPRDRSYTRRYPSIGFTPWEDAT